MNNIIKIAKIHTKSGAVRLLRNLKATKPYKTNHDMYSIDLDDNKFKAALKKVYSRHLKRLYSANKQALELFASNLVELRIRYIDEFTNSISEDNDYYMLLKVRGKIETTIGRGSGDSLPGGEKTSIERICKLLGLRYSPNLQVNSKSFNLGLNYEPSKFIGPGFRENEISEIYGDEYFLNKLKSIAFPINPKDFFNKIYLDSILEEERKSKENQILKHALNYQSILEDLLQKNVLQKKEIVESRNRTKEILKKDVFFDKFIKSAEDKIKERIEGQRAEELEEPEYFEELEEPSEDSQYEEISFKEPLQIEPLEVENTITYDEEELEEDLEEDLEEGTGDKLSTEQLLNLARELKRELDIRGDEQDERLLIVKEFFDKQRTWVIPPLDSLNRFMDYIGAKIKGPQKLHALLKSDAEILFDNARKFINRVIYAAIIYDRFVTSNLLVDKYNKLTDKLAKKINAKSFFDKEEIDNFRTELFSILEKITELIYYEGGLGSNESINFHVNNYLNSDIVLDSSEIWIQIILNSLPVYYVTIESRLDMKFPNLSPPFKFLYEKYASEAEYKKLLEDKKRKFLSDSGIRPPPRPSSGLTRAERRRIERETKKKKPRRTLKRRTKNKKSESNYFDIKKYAKKIREDKKKQVDFFGVKTNNFDICPTSVKTMNKIKEKVSKEKEIALGKELTRQIDDLLGIEKKAISGSANKGDLNEALILNRLISKDSGELSEILNIPLEKDFKFLDMHLKKIINKVN